LRGLVVTLELSPQPIKLSEMRQMDVKVRITNRAKRPVTLEFPNAQRFEIVLPQFHGSGADHVVG
jgi:hypothetical protein